MGSPNDQADPPAPERILRVCALLPWFDGSLLAELGLPPAALDMLVANGSALPAVGPPAAYRLRDELREAVLGAPQAGEPDAEGAVHARAFESLLGRLLAEPAGPWVELYEAQCFHHLDRLFYVLAPRYAWDEIAAYVAKARRHPTVTRGHAHLLAFYTSWIALHQGQHAEAEAALAQALADKGLSDALRARLLNALALSELYRSAYPRALRHFGEAHTAAVAAGELYFQGAALVNMSMLYNDLGDWAEGFRLCREGLTIFERLRDQRRQAIVLYELGNNALYLGRWDAARDYLEQAVRLAVELGLDARLIHAYWAQGLLHHFLGDHEACERCYRLALARASAPTNSDPNLARDILWHLGFLYASQRRWAEALAAYDQALDGEGRPHWRSVIGYQRGRVFAGRGDGEAARAAYRDAIETLEALREATDDEQVKIQLLSTTNQLYEAMVLHCVDQGASAWPEAFDYVERARSRAFLDSMAHRAPELFQTFRQPIVTLAELQAALPPDALLLEYFTTGVVPTGEHAVARLAAGGDALVELLLLPPRVLIFAVTSEQIRVVEAPLDPNDIPSPGDPLMMHRLLRPAMLADLHASLVAPVADLLPGRRVLFLIPHGPLHNVPFNALEDGAGEPLLAADGPAIALAPSATILLRNALGRPAASASDTLALGYNHSGERALTYAEGEAGLVAGLLGGQAHIGPAPKVEALLAGAGAARRLHIACHADYDSVDPLATVLHLGADEQLSARTIIERMELRCELVTLSACTSGLSKVISGDELLGLPRAMLYAGAPTVICTLWEADDYVALLVMYLLYRAIGAGAAPAEALRDAQVQLRSMSGAEVLALFGQLRERWPEQLGQLPPPALHQAQLEHAIFSAPYAWAPFMLIGRP